MSVLNLRVINWKPQHQDVQFYILFLNETAGEPCSDYLRLYMLVSGMQWIRNPFYIRKHFTWWVVVAIVVTPFVDNNNNSETHLSIF